MQATERGIAEIIEQLSKIGASMPNLPPPIVPPTSPPRDRVPSGGMDPWQTSVEKRLDGLQADGRALQVDVTAIKVDVATLKENVRHLPTVPQLWRALAALLAAVGVLVTIIVHFVPHA